MHGLEITYGLITLLDSCAQRRRSLKKSNAISSFGEEETEYSLHRVKLNSKDNSTEDFLILKVKTKSLGSPTSSEKRSLASFTESFEKDSVFVHQTVDKDSPAPSYYRRESDQPIASPDSLLIRRGSGMSDKKSMSEPIRVSTVLVLSG